MCKCVHMCQSTFLQIHRHRLPLSLNRSLSALFPKTCRHIGNTGKYSQNTTLNIMIFV